MALAFRILNRNCFYVYNITQPVRNIIQKNNTARILASGICYQNNIQSRLIEVNPVNVSLGSVRKCSLQGPNVPQSTGEPAEKKGLIQRLKEMYRDYWYVAVPVHVCTSIIWYGSFYYAVRSGVDAIAILQSLGVSESLIKPLRESGAGYFALAFALYKIASPLRYAVTVGGTTYAIKKLTAIGWIKPVPSSQRIKEMFQEKKDTFQDRFNESKHHYQTQIKEKRTQVMDEMRRYRSELRNIKNKVKKT